MNTYNSPLNYGYQLHARQEISRITYQISQHTPSFTLTCYFYGMTNRSWNFKTIGNRIKISSISVKVAHIWMQLLSQSQAAYSNSLQTYFKDGEKSSNESELAIPITLQWTCSSPRRPLFLHALSFECTTGLCFNFLNHFSVYFHT